MTFSRGRFLAFLILLLTAAFPVKLHAGTGIGVEGGITPALLEYSPSNSPHTGEGLPIMLGLTFKSDKLPLIMGAKMQLTDGQVSGGGASADVWLADIQIGYSVFNFYCGPGATLLYMNEIDSGDHKQSKGLFVAPRVFAGLDTMLANVVEAYAQVTVEPGVVFAERDGFIFRINTPVTLGVRFWF